MEDAEAESNKTKVTLFYTPPTGTNRPTRETTLLLGESIWVGKKPGHSGMRLDASGDLHVSDHAVEISLVDEGVQFNPNNINPMRLYPKGSEDYKFPPPVIAVHDEDGWIEILGGEHRDVTHRVSWQLSNLPKKTRLGGTSLKFGAPVGEWVFKELDEKSHLVTCAALVAPRHFKLDGLPESRIPENLEVARLKDKPHATGRKDVENLKKRIKFLYTLTTELNPPEFLSQAGRVELVEWICQYGDLDRNTVGTVLPGLDSFNPQ